MANILDCRSFLKQPLLWGGLAMVLGAVGKDAMGQAFSATNASDNGTPFTNFVNYRFADGGGILFFAGSNSGAFNAVPAISLGTPETTVPLAALPANSGTTLPIDPDEFVTVGNEVFFVGTDAVNGRELWKTDLDTGATTLVKNIRPGSSSSSPRSLVALNGKLVFVANPDNSTVYGEELWISDGTDSGTVMIKDVMPGANGSDISRLQVVGSLAYFGADKFAGSGDVLWRTDGTTAGTFLLKDSGVTSQFPDSFTSFGGTTYFVMRDSVSGNAYALWKTNGTSAGTVVVKSPVTGASADGGVTRPNEIAVANGLMFFRGGSQTTGYELWRSDGTASGTFMVKDIYPGGNSGLGSGSNASPYLTTFNNRVYFAATNGSDGRQLWKSDGTSAGTSVVENVFNASLEPNPRGLIVFQDTLLFRMRRDAYGWEWFSTDGQSISAVPVADINPGPGSGISDLQVSFDSSQVIVGDTLYFTGYNPVVGQELWKLTLSPPPQPPKILSVVRTGVGMYRIQFTGVEGRSYQLRESTNLSGWSNRGLPFVCAPGVNVLNISSGLPTAFWIIQEAP